MSTDLHGNGGDLCALASVFEALGPDAHWLILGDLIHGPDPRSAAREPKLYGFPDESPSMIRWVLDALEAQPDRVHFVLGNHEHGHCGGMHTAKFHRDEVQFLDSTLDPEGKLSLKRLLDRALLGVAAPCGVLFAHGSPDDSLDRLSDLDFLRFDSNGHSPAQRAVLGSFLRSYGQPRERTEALLAKLRATSHLDLRVVIHGHDRDEYGVFREGGNQLCPVIFGALREHKRYVLLDLAARYSSLDALRDGFEVLRLYP